jgi:undecaprenyl-diphosphatase
MFLLQNNLLQLLERWDRAMFVKVNGQWTNSFFDAVMPFMREALNWAPLYIFLIAFALLNFKARGGWWVVFLLCTVALTDMTGTYLFKHNFERVRPCGDPDLFSYVRLLVNYCSSGHSFTSNHAANHMGMATFFYFTTRAWLGRWAMIGFVWAALIGYAQIYVGVHFPFDVLVGLAIGALIGSLTARLYIKRHGIVIFDQQSTVAS